MSQASKPTTSSSAYDQAPRSGEEGPTSGEFRAQLTATEALVDVAQELSMARDLTRVMAIVRHAARELTGADGATFVLADGDSCFYADEEAIAPLWKGLRFPLHSCISGWVMLNRKAAIIEDVFADARIPHDVYCKTFVKSLAMVPIRATAPIGAIGNYWARGHEATAGQVKVLQALADLTSVAMENVRLYDQLERRIREAEDAVLARDEFITVAAHELRTPFTALQLQLQSLQARAKEEESSLASVSREVSRAVVTTKRLAALLDGLLDASRLVHGPLRLDVEEFDLGELAREVVERFSRFADRAGCAMTVEASPSVRGLWDRVRIEQVLTNLVSNAIKYGAGAPILVTLEREPSSARLRVCDRGMGISPEVAAKIFERFGRAGPVNHYGGLGLGLYLAREIVQAHGGTIRFESVPKEGCTFIVELPLGAQAPE